MLYFEGLDHAAHHIPGSEKRPASTGNMITRDRTRTFTPKAICDTSKAVEVLISLACDTRERVDELVTKALAAGGTTYDAPEDLGFMYSHSFVDLDGHGWGVLHMSAA